MSEIFIINIDQFWSHILSFHWFTVATLIVAERRCCWGSVISCADDVIQCARPVHGRFQSKRKISYLQIAQKMAVQMTVRRAANRAACPPGKSVWDEELAFRECRLREAVRNDGWSLLQQRPIGHVNTRLTVIRISLYATWQSSDTFHNHLATAQSLWLQIFPPFTQLSIRFFVTCFSLFTLRELQSSP